MSQLVTVGSSLKEYSDRLKSFFNGDYMGAPTGLSQVDEMVFGLHPGKLYMVGARPAMGKSSYMLLVIYTTAVVARRPVIVYSLEMDQMELVERLACMDAMVDSQRLKRGALSEAEWARFSHSFGRLCSAPIWVSDSPVVQVDRVSKELQEFKQEIGDIGLVAVDYVQLMDGQGENRQTEISKISRHLKIMAREVDIPVMVLSQLSRRLEERVDKRPMMSDLRESGSLEQDADVVLFLYRDEVYNPDSEDKGLAEVIVAKHRGGPTGTVKVSWVPEHTRFADLPK